MDFHKNHPDNIPKTTPKPIKGRATYRKERKGKSFENNVHQPDGSHNLQLSDTQFSYPNPYETPTPDDSEIDEVDFSLQYNGELLPFKRHTPATPPLMIGESYKRPLPLSETLSPGKKQKHYRGLAYTSQQDPDALLKTHNWYIIIVIIIIAIIVAFVNWIPPDTERTDKNPNQRFVAHLKNQGAIFNLPKDFLLKIKSGVNTIYNAESAGSFTILYNSGEQNFHKREFNEMVQAIANVTAQYLRNGNGGVIELESNNIKLANHEELMHSYKSSLLELGVMLVKDLDNLPTNLAMAFHYFCDEYDPLVKKSAIFFTIDKQKCSIQSKSEPHKWIEKCLSEKWRHMRDDSISPLLTRVVDVVVEI